MNIRRPMAFYSAASALAGLLGGILTAGERVGTIMRGDSGRKPYPVRHPKPQRSYIRGRGPHWAGWAMPVVGNKARCDARNHPEGKFYSADDLLAMKYAQEKRERKQAKRLRDVAAMAAARAGQAGAVA